MILEELKRRLWVDDLRDPPGDGIGFDIARTYNEAIKLLNTNRYDVAYFDHDLADFSGPNGREMTGDDVALYIAQMKRDGHPVPYEYHILTDNAAGRNKLERTIKYDLMR